MTDLPYGVAVPDDAQDHGPDDDAPVTFDVGAEALAEWALEVGQSVQVEDANERHHHGYVSTLTSGACLVLTPEPDTYAKLDRIAWPAVVAVADVPVVARHPADA